MKGDPIGCALVNEVLVSRQIVQVLNGFAVGAGYPGGTTVQVVGVVPSHISHTN